MAKTQCVYHFPGSLKQVNIHTADLIESITMGMVCEDYDKEDILNESFRVNN